MAKKSPLQQQKETFGDKEKLVDRVVTVLKNIRTSSESDEDLKGKLLAASNKKLIHLFAIGSDIAGKFGSVDKLADATAQAMGRVKDMTYVAKLKTLAPSKLYDLYRVAARRAKHQKAA